jgi:hypothetical protein
MAPGARYKRQTLHPTFSRTVGLEGGKSLVHTGGQGRTSSFKLQVVR